MRVIQILTGVLCRPTKFYVYRNFTEICYFIFDYNNHFYPRDAILARVVAVIVCPCVCVCLSHACIVSKWIMQTSHVIAQGL